MVILDPTLIKTGKRMNEMEKELQKSKTGLEKHNTLLEYYRESSFARVKAIRYVCTMYI